MLIKKTGNLLDLAEAGEFDVIFHGANCFNTMGGGIAKEIRERFPAVAEVDATTVRGDYNKLGNWTGGYVGTQNRFTILNCYTQFNMSRNTDVFEYTAFALILQKITHAFPGKRLGVPYIGMGLAGGDKNRILPMLEEFAKEMAKANGTVTLVEFK